MSTRAAAWLAWLLGALCAVLLAPTLYLLVLNLSHPGVRVWDIWVHVTVVAATYPALGVLIVSRRPEHPIGWLFCAVGLLGGIDHFCAEYAIYALLAQPDYSLPAGQVAAWVVFWIWVPINALWVFVGLLFPNGRLPSRRWRPLAWFIGAVVVVGSAVEALLPVRSSSLGSIENPLGIEGLENVYGLLADALISAFSYGVFGIVAVASLFLRFSRAGGMERQQIKWLAYAASLLVLGAILAYGAYSATGARWTWQVGAVLLVLGSAGIPIAVGIAILKYRLYEIDIIINRTLVYGALTATLAMVYFGGIVLLQRVLVALTSQKSTLAVVASTLVIAALFNPLRRRIRAFIDRSFYRRKYDARETLEAFSAKLRDETDLDALSEDLVEVVRETMQPAHVSLWLRPDTTPKGESPGPPKESLS